MSVEFEGYQRARAALLQTQAAARPGVLGSVVRNATAKAHRYAVAITHVWHHLGGALKASHTMRLTRTRGEIYLNPSAPPRRGRTRPAEYGVYEERRGGSHAFYDRTAREAGPKIMQGAVRELKRKLP